jgi:DNA-directed RNA polymerase subunit alpha
MSQILHAPNLASIDDHSATSSTFVVEPLNTGYGMTLGNSLRRVLLSSISGAAAVAFRIEGATHEFTTVKGVKEDVVDIMLNVKQLRFRIFSDEAQTIRIVKKGTGAVTGADIKVNADIEVVNPEQVICTIDDKATELIIDIIVEKGRGYRTTEERSEAANSADYIALDAMYTPVLRVRYKVESTRVGQQTDYDKLLVTVDTDGSMTTRDAFEQAGAILAAQYSALAGQTTVVTAPAVVRVSPDDMADDNNGESAEMMTSIEHLNLSARTTNALINNDIHTVKDLVSLSPVELKELKGFGSKALDEVRDKIAELEL